MNGLNPLRNRIFASALILMSSLMCSFAPATQAQAGDDLLLLYLPSIIKAAKDSQSEVTTSTETVRPDTTPTQVITGPGVARSEAELRVSQSGDLLTVQSNAAPTWKVVFAIGNGAPGGGTAISLYVPASAPQSAVENRPFMNCCSGLGLDNLEWRWRPFGGTNGTRAALGVSSVIDSFTINSQTDRKLVFTIRGRWSGVSSFTRRTEVTIDGYSSDISATYAGTTGNDSMWWLISAFPRDQLNAGAVTIRDANTGPFTLRRTRANASLPSGIGFPYTISYPLRTGYRINMTMSQLGGGGGNPNSYEFFDANELVGPYYLIYPRWNGVHRNTTYRFVYRWRFSS